MRTIEQAMVFKRDYKREKKGRFGATFSADIKAFVDKLAADEVLPQNYKDHALRGRWSDHRDCHIRPDLILIYRKPNADRIELVRLGSHSELSL